MTSPASTEAVFRTQMAAYAACDVEGLLASFTADCVLVDMADPANPFIGKDAVNGFLIGYFATLRNVAVDVTHVAAGEDLVIGELDVTADYVGAPFCEERPGAVRLRYCVAEEIRDGRVARERFYWDSGDFARQLAARAE
jgi:ketosteroid isomerase-like protein